ncbi:hypothetical protein CEXT_547591 [Caerostris extrusa]|uniref:Uncharacterized protein n=1 Tax=Caerostris extrusa TaxID=172846 RepID=A0AAV4N3G2_CAEEX|nr:hypothetical protein CEXT_547591 [Caerostris extrusa]
MISAIYLGIPSMRFQVDIILPLQAKEKIKDVEVAEGGKTWIRTNRRWLVSGKPRERYGRISRNAVFWNQQMLVNGGNGDPGITATGRTPLEGSELCMLEYLDDLSISL